MEHIRVVWKDGNQNKSFCYRKTKVVPYRDGWVLEGMGDDNIYKTIDSAKNAIDEVLGVEGRRRNITKRDKRIIVIGTKGTAKHTTA